jgi:hypothetical protein
VDAHLLACVFVMSLAMIVYIIILWVHVCFATGSDLCRPVFKRVLYTALTPTINMLSVAGLISIPGMMTGQILAGSNAIVAAKYQVCSTSCLRHQLFLTLVQPASHQIVAVLLGKTHTQRRAMHCAATSREAQVLLGTLVYCNLWQQKREHFPTVLQLGPVIGMLAMQIMILFGVAAVGAVACTSCITLATLALTDSHHRLRLDRLVDHNFHVFKWIWCDFDLHAIACMFSARRL